MNGKISLGVALLALILSIVAITSAYIYTPEMTLPDSSIDKNKIADDSITSEKIIDDTITDEDIAEDAITSNHIHSGTILLSDLSSEVIASMSGVVEIPDDSITGEEIADDSISTSHIIDGTITLSDLSAEVLEDISGVAEIPNDSINSDHIEDHKKTISFPAKVLAYDSDIIRENNDGLLWDFTWDGGAVLLISRPYDWDGESNVDLHLYFITNTTKFGRVEFFIRPAGVNPGSSSFISAESISNGTITVGAEKIYKQSFSIPASKYGSKELWSTSIQRKGDDATYSDQITLITVSLTYNAIR
jgi:hypothetical protein